MKHPIEKSVTGIPTILLKDKIRSLVQSLFCLFGPFNNHTAIASSNCPAAFCSYLLRILLNTSSVVLHSPAAICRSDSSIRALISSMEYGSNFLRDLEVTVFSSVTNHINSSSEREFVIYSKRPFNAIVLITFPFSVAKVQLFSKLASRKGEKTRKECRREVILSGDRLLFVKCQTNVR